MMRRPLTIVAVLLICSTLAIAQEALSLEEKDLAGAKIVKTESYTGKALFGYIDGGAELYLEYGFKNLQRQEVDFSGEKFVVEIYQMAGANEAYGVFSVQRFKCVPVDSLYPMTCLSRYQLQAVVGSRYLSITNESGSSNAQRRSVEILRALNGKSRAQSLQIPAIFHDPSLKKFLSRLVIVHGPLGLQNGYADWLSFFDGFDVFTVYLLPLESGSGRFTVAYIRFSCCDDIEKFCHAVGVDQKLTGELQAVTNGETQVFLRQLGKQILLFAEGSRSFPDLASVKALLSR